MFCDLALNEIRSFSRLPVDRFSLVHIARFG